VGCTESARCPALQTKRLGPLRILKIQNPKPALWYLWYLRIGCILTAGGMVTEIIASHRETAGEPPLIAVLTGEIWWHIQVFGLSHLSLCHCHMRLNLWLGSHTSLAHLKSIPHTQTSLRKLGCKSSTLPKVTQSTCLAWTVGSLLTFTLAFCCTLGNHIVE
jgi:hypothetical protein